MAKPDMGLKRQCGNCGTKFFDFGRDKIVCPKCGTPFVAAPLPTRSAARAAPARVADEEKDEDTGADETISLEEADAGDDSAAASTSDVNVEDDDDEAANDTFLEEEEEDGDDVSGLIDGDIETDEEP